MVTLKIMRAINEENDLIATEVRSILAEYQIVTLNFMSAPGSGKTSLLETTLDRMGKEWRFGAIVGDLFTTKDGDRLEKHGIPVVQLNTEGACHLTAQMLKESLAEFYLPAIDALFVENVGNLVCPGSFDLGEDFRVTLVSAAEGADKVDKYPKMFRQSSANIISKIDLLPYVNFDLNDVVAKLQLLNPEAPVFALSATTGEGMEDWCSWLREILTESAEAGT